MKFKLLAATLGLASISLKAGMFGGKPFASFNEEQLDTIEGALVANDNSELQSEVERLTNEVAEHTAAMTTIENAVNTALELNGLEAEKISADSIKLLGKTCKAYGEKKSVHTHLSNNGEELNLEEDKLINGYFDPNDEHNNID